jgi:hypothetical protein
MESADCINGNDEIIRKAANSLSDARSFAHRIVGSILNSYQCKIP